MRSAVASIQGLRLALYILAGLAVGAVAAGGVLAGPRRGAAAQAYRVYIKKVPDPKSTAGYTMDHSALIYVMGPDGAYRTHFAPGISVDTLAERLGKLL